VTDEKLYTQLTSIFCNVLDDDDIVLEAELSAVGWDSLSHIRLMALECIKADYDRVIQEALSPDSIINRAKPNAVLIALDYRGFPLQFIPAKADVAVQLALKHLEMIRAGTRQNGKAISIVQPLAIPLEALFGSFDRATMGTSQNPIESLNSAIVESIVNEEDLSLDITSLAETVGLAAWRDPTFWNMAKVPFSSTFVPLYADHADCLISASQSKSRCCLVLDLDNTIWGGLIGDEGLDESVSRAGMISVIICRHRFPESEANRARARCPPDAG
jgi:predicted enzyme involved in methoxymalonyl-ACP biosynthesis